jgi:hypothetical protein
VSSMRRMVALLRQQRTRAEMDAACAVAGKMAARSNPYHARPHPRARARESTHPPLCTPSHEHQAWP